MTAEEVVEWIEASEGTPIRHLSPEVRAHYVWRWMDESRVAAIPDGDLMAYHREDGEWRADGRQYLREQALRALGPHYSTAVLAEVEERARAHRSVESVEALEP